MGGRFAVNIREALRTYGPSLTLQRAALDEIARLDSRVAELEAELRKVPQPDVQESSWGEFERATVTTGCR
jgi:hypothetical protein